VIDRPAADMFQMAMCQKVRLWQQHLASRSLNSFPVQHAF
jgi:hypothetical protein